MSLERVGLQPFRPVAPDHPIEFRKTGGDRESIMRQDQRVYFAFFVLELVGMFAILWDGIPIFRNLLIVRQTATTGDHLIMFCAAAGILVAYWSNLRFAPPFSLPRAPFFAHVLLFCSRLSFVFASSIFSVAVYRYSNLLELSFTKVMVFCITLFAIFCFSRHIESLGNSMLSGRRRLGA